MGGQEPGDRVNLSRSSSRHYIKERGYVTPVGWCGGTEAWLNTSRCVKQEPQPKHAGKEEGEEGRGYAHQNAA